ncbi:hypothetical protein K2173_013268 [Erythroxylum novogranatense]|uniref:HMA domain-containing protein n=1 Tax=Erythroxylum novogranatense TaxID=1862640 RepID=A0AAV8TW84_9ROSI|nr:hypothetical protein K2173_013268 [Erythroxylum novogranatense]
MKQKIVLKVAMHCQKCHRKALKIVAVTDGVTFVSIEGDFKEIVVVIGDNIDPVKLTAKLRKKVGATEIISVVTM